jgi:hypothetical protein
MDKQGDSSYISTELIVEKWSWLGGQGSKRSGDHRHLQTGGRKKWVEKSQEGNWIG